MLRCPWTAAQRRRCSPRFLLTAPEVVERERIWKEMNKEYLEQQVGSRSCLCVPVPVHVCMCAVPCDAQRLCGRGPLTGDVVYRRNAQRWDCCPVRTVLASESASPNRKNAARPFPHNKQWARWVLCCGVLWCAVLLRACGCVCVLVQCSNAALGLADGRVQGYGVKED